MRLKFNNTEMHCCDSAHQSNAREWFGEVITSVKGFFIDELLAFSFFSLMDYSIDNGWGLVSVAAALLGVTLLGLPFYVLDELGND